MDKLKVLVGLMYTQVMFCDENGKLQFHRVMTDINRPWLSIKEVLRMVKLVLCMDKPIGYNRLIQSVHIDMQYRKIDFAFILQTLREEMERDLSEGCEVIIQTINDYYEIDAKKTEVKEDEWGIDVWEFRPLEAMDHNEKPDVIQAFLVQKEWDGPLIYSEYGILRSYEPSELFQGRIMGCEVLLEVQIPLLSIDGGRSNLKKETDLRGSPIVSHSFIMKEEWAVFST